MATRNSETDELNGTEDKITKMLQLEHIHQNSFQFDISAQTKDFIELLQDKDLKAPWKPPPTSEGGDWASDSSGSEVEEIFESDVVPITFQRRKELSRAISQSGLQNYPHKEPMLVLTDNMKETTTHGLYGLLTCARYLQPKDIRSKMDAIGIKKKIETGKYTAHSSEYLYLLYSFPNQKTFNEMCTNLMSNASKVVRAKTKKSDRIPLSLHPARPIFSKLKCCLEFYIPPPSFKTIVDSLQPIFGTLEQSLFCLSGNSQSQNRRELTPHDTAFAVNNEDELPSFAVCLQFITKTIKSETNALFGQFSWSNLSPFPDNRSMLCYVNMVYGKCLPFIFCATEVDPAIHDTNQGLGFAIYVLVPSDKQSMVLMTSFYDVLLSDTGKALKGGRVMYRLISDDRCDMELVLIEVPAGKTLFRQNALTLYVHTMDVLSLLCKLQCKVSAHGNHCVAIEDPLGNKVVLRDFSSAPHFKAANPSEGLVFTN